MNDKRIIQISLDIIVDKDCDGDIVSYDVTNELNKRGFKVIGAGFQEDMTEVYEKCYPNLIN